MKATNKVGKQRGFFSVGVSLALFPIFSATATGITIVQEADEDYNERLVMQAETNSTPNASSKLESRHVR